MQSFASAGNLAAARHEYIRKANGPAIYQQTAPVLLAGAKSRRLPALVKINRLLKTTLIALCGIALLGYGLDVAASHDVSQLHEQARRLCEQNTELSAQLLHIISFQGIADSAAGHSGLKVPDQVLIVKEIQPCPLVPFQRQRHYLPLMAGY